MKNIKIQESDALSLVSRLSQIPKEHLKERILLRLQKRGLIEDRYSFANQTLGKISEKLNDGYQSIVDLILFANEQTQEALEVFGSITLIKNLYLTKYHLEKAHAELVLMKIGLSLDWDQGVGYMELKDYPIETENYSFTVDIMVREEAAGDIVIKKDLDLVIKEIYIGEDLAEINDQGLGDRLSDYLTNTLDID